MRHPMNEDKKKGLHWGRGRKSLMESWPKTADGEPVPPAFLAHTIPNNFADEMMVNLRDAGSLRDSNDTPASE